MAQHFRENYDIKDSGKRAMFTGGMVRDTDEGKPRPDLIRDGPMFWRWIDHLTKGAEKYEARNWMLGVNDPATLDRALQSADRHYEQWRRGDTDEDHAAAVFFNINQVEYYKLCRSERFNSEDYEEVIGAEAEDSGERPCCERIKCYCGHTCP